MKSQSRNSNLKQIVYLLILTFECGARGCESMVLARNTATPGGERANGVKIEGFGAVAQKRGAKAVMATLRSVADESTGALMSEFYRLRKDNPNLTKAEAMQKAQLSMIQGRLKPSGSSAGCRSEVVNLEGTRQPSFKYGCECATFTSVFLVAVCADW
jgi:CHAT domain-containing protein